MQEALAFCQLCPAGSPGIPISKFDEHQKIHEPQPEHDNGVQYYSEHVRGLLHSQQHKINKLLEHNCIDYSGAGAYICKPLEGYNKTTYTLRKNEDGIVECTCQYYQTTIKQTEEEVWCAHKGALYEFWARRGKGA